MIKILRIILTILVTSFFFFPFYFLAFPSVNTKMMLAAIGLVLAAFELIRQQGLSVPRELIILMLLCGMVSIVSLISITYNQTPDTAYVSYIVSAAVWLSGAFTVCWIIRSIHGRIDVPLVTHYLIGTCLFQCASAMAIEFIPDFSQFIDRYIDTGQNLMREVDRLYGIGALLDVAGARFSAVLVAIAFLLTSSPKGISVGKAIFYTLSFVVISIIGNMMARTTTVGLLIGVGWLLVAPFIWRTERSRKERSGICLAVVTTTAFLIALSVVLYNTSPEMKEFFRFGFEGFFSLVETGEWQVDSNDTLKSMVVWPEELKTWIIGDGYFLNSRYDPNYLGTATDEGYYMGTDIGYLRFIFYFGIAGLIWIVAVIAYSAIVCANQFKLYSWLFILALGVGLVVWAKVSTDIFCFFSLFLCAAALQEEPLETVSASETSIIDAS